MLEFLQFVARRRPVAEYGILPGWKPCLIVVLLVCISLVVTIIYADVPYHEWYYSRLWYQDRSSIFFMTTDFGKSEWILISTATLMVIMGYYGLPSAERTKIIEWNQKFFALYFIFTAVAFSGLITVGLKILIGRARPVKTLPEHDAWYSLPWETAVGHGGFPSGHTTTIAAFSMACALLAPRFRFWFLALALWVGASRSVVGAHFPSDVVAGLAVGGIFTWLHARNFARKRMLFSFDRNGGLRSPVYKVPKEEGGI